MLNNDKTGLKIFDNFQIDFKLPKWQDKFRQNESGSVNSFGRRGGNTIGGLSAFVPSNDMPMSVSGSDGSKNQGPSWWDRTFHRKRLLKEEQRHRDEANKSNFTVEPPLENSVPEITVEEFFKSVKNNTEELQTIGERLKTYEDALEHLKNSGQVALYELMCADVEIHRAETQLHTAGYKKVITEKNVIDFAAKADRALKLDWVKNFTRLIPKKVIDTKVKLDELLIFDNYCVLHFDPEGKGSELTEQEKIKKKDPILFGVIAGSPKLYYVGDWIDEYCDLTFDKIVEKLGDDAITANDIQANVVIPEVV